MKADQLLSSVCYFSSLFTLILFPIIVYILAPGDIRHQMNRTIKT